MSNLHIQDELNKIDFMTSFAKDMRDEFWRLRPDHVKILSKMESFLSRYIELSKRITQQIDDNFMSIDEGIELRENLDSLLRDVYQFLDNHEYNKQYLNQLIVLATRLDDLLVTVTYLKGIERTMLSDRYHGIEENGFFIDSSVKYEIYQQAKEVLQKSKPSAFEEFGEVETAFIDFIRFMSHCDVVLSDDVIYGRKPSPLEKLHQQRDLFKNTLFRLTYFYKDGLITEQLEEALSGVTKILEHEEMRTNQQVKLTGFISRVDGYTDIKNLAKEIRTI